MEIRKLVTFEDAGFVQWGVLTPDEKSVYSAIALVEACPNPCRNSLPKVLKDSWLWLTVWNKMKGPEPCNPRP